MSIGPFSLTILGPLRRVGLIDLKLSISGHSYLQTSPPFTFRFPFRLQRLKLDPTSLVPPSVLAALFSPNDLLTQVNLALYSDSLPILLPVLALCAPKLTSLRLYVTVSTTPPDLAPFFKNCTALSYLITRHRTEFEWLKQIPVPLECWVVQISIWVEPHRVKVLQMVIDLMMEEPLALAKLKKLKLGFQPLTGLALVGSDWEVNLLEREKMLYEKLEEISKNRQIKLELLEEEGCLDWPENLI